MPPQVAFNTAPTSECSACADCTHSAGIAALDRNNETETACFGTWSDASGSSDDSDNREQRLRSEPDRFDRGPTQPQRCALYLLIVVGRKAAGRPCRLPGEMPYSPRSSNGCLYGAFRWSSSAQADLAGALNCHSIIAGRRYGIAEGTGNKGGRGHSRVQPRPLAPGER